ncbi:hypothetical protein Bca4012_017591 [Brassica carinata]
MSVAVPILLPMDDFLVERQDMWKRALRFILRMTSGVVYSIVMHILLITAYTLLTFHIFYTRGFLVLFNDVLGLFVLYLVFGLVEIVARASFKDQMCVTVSGHVSHLMGSMLLLGYRVPSDHIEAFAFCFLGIPLFFWTFFIMWSTFIPEFLGDDSLIQPLV